MEVSPSAKGTLDGFLVKSPDARSQVELHKEQHSPLKSGIVGRNLTVEMNVDSCVQAKPVSPSCFSRDGDSSLKAKDQTRIQTGLNFEASADGNGPNDTYIGEKITETLSEGTENLELRRFPNDLLSLYCSELSSAVDVEVDQKLNGQKRKCSPSLVVANGKLCAKKQCLEVQEVFPTKVANLSLEGCSQLEGSSLRTESEEAVVGHPLEVEVYEPCRESNMAERDPFTGTRKCTDTPTSGSHVGGCYMPASVNVSFPGEEFWNEAIQVSDCVFAPTDKPSYQETLFNDKGGVHDPNLPDIDEETRSQSAVNLKYDAVSTPSSSMPRKDSLQLSSWLSSELCSVYMKNGISKLYRWQVDCLQVDGVLENRNLVYCASTSAGKSFVAEILILRRIISTGKIAFLVLPYVSICAEKAEHLELLLEPLGKHVRSFYGNQGGGTLPKDTSVAVCTIEKANVLINRLLEEGRLSEIGIVVIDELHLVGDQHRGYLLEHMLTKLLYASGEGNAESCSEGTTATNSGRSDLSHGLQIVGMSATMPNVAAVADWLHAALFQTDFRPVPLEEYIKVGNNIFNKKLDVIRTIPKIADLGGKDPDHIVKLCDEVVQEGQSVLFFCSSRRGCESTARHLSKFLKCFSVSISEVACEYSDSASVLETLRRCPAGLDPILEETIPSGVAYHHAGLTAEEREIVETCYRKRLIRVLAATSTLASGVNLPARRVIFRQPCIGRDFIDGTSYRQMAGRAGRTGIDTRGESILICKQEDIKRITAMLNDCCPPLQSCLSDDKNGMIHAILEVVACGIVQTPSDIHRYVRCTLLNSTKPFEAVVKSAQDSLCWLGHHKFLEWNEHTQLYTATPLGHASFGSSLSPKESLVVLDDLSRAREGFVLSSDLHLVYLVTPINVDVEPNWDLYYERFMQLSTLDQSVGNRVGVTEPFLMRMAHGAPWHISDRSKGKNKQHSRLQVHELASDKGMLSDDQTVRVAKRFYVALMVSRLVQEVPMHDVCEAFKVARGMIQILQEKSGWFASMVSLFCERLGWHDLRGLIAKFQNRVSFGVRSEIVELTNIPYVKGSRARALYKAGLRTPVAIAEASIPTIAKALFESSSWNTQEGTSMRYPQLGVAKKIKNGACKIVVDQAEEARLTAFSAFKSLGVHIPQLSRPLLSSNFLRLPGSDVVQEKVVDMPGL